MAFENSPSSVVSFAEPSARRQQRLSSSVEDVELQQRLAQTRVERDAQKQVLHRFSSVVGSYMQRLRLVASDLDGGSPTGKNELCDILKAFEVEASAVDSQGSSSATQARQESIIPSIPPTIGQNYEVLRSALEDAHNRCESLNNDMAQQNSANQELVDALGTVKDANKRLLEQIRFQTYEISQLTTQRVTDEERLDQLTRAHQADRDRFRKDAQRQCIEIRQRLQEQHAALQQSLKDARFLTQTRSIAIQQTGSRLTEELHMVRRDAAIMMDTVRGQLHALERDLVQRCAQCIDSHLRRKTTTQNALVELGSDARREHEHRANDSLTWEHRYAELCSDKDALQARKLRDQSQLASQKQAVERSLKAERAAWVEVRERLRRKADHGAEKRRQLQEEHERLERQLVDLTSRMQAAEAVEASDVADVADENVIHLRQALRESDDALAAAVNGNEHLRVQMEAQRVLFKERNEAALTACKSECEDRFDELCQAQDAALALAKRSLETMQETVQQEEMTSACEAAQADTLTSEVEELRVLTYRQKVALEDVHTLRRQLEREHTDLQKHFAMEGLRLCSISDKLDRGVATICAEVELSKEELETLRRRSTAMVTNHETRYESNIVQLRSLETQRDEMKGRLKELEDAKARTRLELDHARRRSGESLSMLESSMQARRREFEEEKDRLRIELAAQTKARESNWQELTREKEEGVSAMQRVQDDSRAKFEALQHDKAVCEERARSNIVSAREAYHESEKRVENLELELAHLRGLIQESESNLAYLRAEWERSERENLVAHRALDEEVLLLQTQCNRAHRDADSATRQLEELHRRNEDDQRRLKRELEVARSPALITLGGMSAVEPRSRPQMGDEPRRCSSMNQSSELAGTSFFQDADWSRSGFSRDGLGLHSLHSKLESHIERLQRHTEELRGSLYPMGSTGGGEVVTKAPPLPGTAAPSGSPGRYRGATQGAVRTGSAGFTSDVGTYSPQRRSGSLSRGGSLLHSDSPLHGYEGRAPVVCHSGHRGVTSQWEQFAHQRGRMLFAS